MNRLFQEEIRGHHSMRDLVLAHLADDALDYRLPGNPTLGTVLVELGNLEGVYTRSFLTSVLDWEHIELPAPAMTVESIRAWFDEQDSRMEDALEAIPDSELRDERIPRGDEFVVSPVTQLEIYREAVYIVYGKLSVYVRALGVDLGPSWAAWIG